jgi:hypothetical protein
MVKTISLIIIFSCISSLGLLAQTTIERQSISAGGSNYTMANETYMVSATIGQTVSGTMSNENYIVTAGFQQTGLTMVNIFTAETVELSVFPNPGTDFVMIKTDLVDYSLKIFDMKGAVVFSKLKTNGNYVVDIVSYSSGEYIIQLFGTNGNLLSATKIIKN